MWTDLDARSRRITIEESAFTAEITVIRPSPNSFTAGDAALQCITDASSATLKGEAVE